MPTKYQCKGCGATFEDDPPVDFSDGQVFYPLCQASKKNHEHPFPGLDLKVSALTDAEFHQLLDWAIAVKTGHPVGLAIDLTITGPEGKKEVDPPSATLKGSWGKAPLKLTADATPVVAKPLPVFKVHEPTPAEKAAKLIAHIDKLIAQGDGGGSGNYGHDKQYGTTGKYAVVKAATAKLAIAIWTARATQQPTLNYHTMRGWKTSGNRDCYQVNFLRKLAPNSQGKHNVHVTISDASHM